jgi:hypothetical protein
LSPSLTGEVVEVKGSKDLDTGDFGGEEGVTIVAVAGEAPSAD